MELTIIIVNFNTSALLQKCLNSVFSSSFFLKNPSSCEVYVVDNASTDGSIDLVKEHFPRVNLIINKTNLGFARANNVAIRKAKGKLILLLNSDTQLQPNALDESIAAINSDKKAAIVGAALFNGDGTIQSSFGFLPQLVKIFYWMLFIDDLPFASYILKPYHFHNNKYYTQKLIVEWVTGAFFLIKKNIAEKVGYFDENIFMYGEEVEWCYRITKSGFKVIYAPSAIVLHEKGASGIGANAGIVEEFRSILYLYKKHKSKKEYFIARSLLLFGALLRLLLFGIIAGDTVKAKLYVKAIQMVR